MKVYSITAFDNANDEPPRTSVFSIEDDEIIWRSAQWPISLTKLENAG